MNEGATLPHEVDVCFVEPRGLAGHQSDGDFHTSVAQLREALPGDERVRVFNRRDDAPDAGFNQRECAGRGASGVRGPPFEREEAVAHRARARRVRARWSPRARRIYR